VGLENVVKHAEELRATLIVQVTHLITYSQLSQLLQKSDLMKFINQWAFVWEKQKKDSSTNLLQDWRIPARLLKRWNRAKLVTQRIIWRAGIINLRSSLLHVNKGAPGHHLDHTTRLFQETQMVRLDQLVLVMDGHRAANCIAERYLVEMWPHDKDFVELVETLHLLQTHPELPIVKACTNPEKYAAEKFRRLKEDRVGKSSKWYWTQILRELHPDQLRPQLLKVGFRKTLASSKLLESFAGKVFAEVNQFEEDFHKHHFKHLK
jgi:hypothetical protein